MIKDSSVNGVCRWVHTKKMDKAKVGKATCLRVSAFKRVGGRTITKGQDKGLKVLQASNRKKGGRKVAYK